MADTATVPAGTECGATPLDGTPHGGQVSAYVRICPAGRVRSGYACAACAGTGAILCAGCGDKRPAILIPAETWELLIVRDLDIEAAADAVGAAMITRSGPREIALAAFRAAGFRTRRPEKV